MPSLTEHELLELRAECFDTEHPQLAMGLVMERVRKWGPVPCHVLTNVDSDAQQLLDDTVDAHQLVHLQSMLSRPGTSISATHVSPNILHFVVDRVDFHMIKYDFASMYVCEKTLERIATEQTKDVLQFMRKQFEVPQKMGTNILEYWINKLFSSGKLHELQARRLTTVPSSQYADLAAANECVGFTSLKVNSLKGKLRFGAADVLNCNSPDELKSWKSGTRCIMRAGFPSIGYVEDMGVPSNATTNKQHGLLMLGSSPSIGLVAVARHLQTIRDEPATHLIPFIWLVPESQLEDFESQPCVTAKMSAYATNSSISAAAFATMAAEHENAAKEACALHARIVQYAVGVPIPDPEMGEHVVLLRRSTAGHPTIGSTTTE
jgi:hypothetical protein